ncbi:putative citrate lyase beta subunit [Sphingomonas changbaiensis NBRC 104936]|uniref:Putative citrate lyase beta subunit n=1 Tax=Sphingomonas changbaiensis NBRC 104936 TaxID=1219043 RepID=A0A0E9MMG5_9SPHN|nr:CoA ester lyase [Sphingomonas changbaiensis]GAO38330.1 putative citrate lyase beta subunit [Sphingomonas changbaiensis NBRC 104936]
MRLRSLLFVPGDRPERMEKALTLGADALILDLEDSVAPANKAAARAAIADFLTLSQRERVDSGDSPSGVRATGHPHPSAASRLPPSPDGRGRPFLFVRINPLDSGHLDDDLYVLAGNPDGLVLPKAEGAESVWRLAGRAAVPILPIATETPAAVFRLGGYGPVAEHLAGLTWGAEDLPAAIGATASRDETGAYLPPYQIARALTLFGAAAAGVNPIETVYPAIKDLDGLRRIAEAAARDGFTGMMAIHPAQVPVINAAFTPSAEAVAQARAIVAAFDANPGAGALQLDGKMIDAPHLKQARRILERANP